MDFGLPAELASPHNWREAVVELEKMERLLTPSQKLGKILVHGDRAACL